MGALRGGITTVIRCDLRERSKVGIPQIEGPPRGCRCGVGVGSSTHSSGGRLLGKKGNEYGSGEARLKLRLAMRFCAKLRSQTALRSLSGSKLRSGKGDSATCRWAKRNGRLSHVAVFMHSHNQPVPPASRHAYCSTNNTLHIRPSHLVAEVWSTVGGYSTQSQCPSLYTVQGPGFVPKFGFNKTQIRFDLASCRSDTFFDILHLGG